MSWYRTYRPQTIAGLHITKVRDAFLRILSSGSFSHAYLLSGPKGTGKTSAARILAKALNCEQNRSVVEKALSKKGSGGKLLEPCNTCSACLSITNGSSLSVSELDAASNRGIDDIRELRERIGLSPPDGLVSVFIIDEVHMLTIEAFNSLLKILEEPPAHVVFILATTDPQKLPATILSRCIQVQYTKASITELTAALSYVVQREKLEIASQELERIAQVADGSFRDAVKLLETAALQGKEILESHVDSVIGTSPIGLVSSLLQSLLKKDIVGVTHLFDTLLQSGIDPLSFHKKVLETLHVRLVEYAAISDPRLTTIIKLLSKLAVNTQPTSPFPHLPFELACLEWCVWEEKQEVRNKGQGTSTKERETENSQQVSEVRGKRSVTSDQSDEVRGQKQESLQTTPQAIQEKAKTELEEVQTAAVNTQLEPPPIETPSEEKETVSVGAIDIDFSVIESKWSGLLREIRSKSVPVEGLLRSVRPHRIDGSYLVCIAGYQFHKEQLELDRNRHIVETALEQLVHIPVKIKFELGKAAQKVVHLPDSNISGNTEDTALVKAAENAFL